ncbi:MAG: DUF2752 domain-containing protein [Planctomycetes bacterium]|nr:DUF2752 domain-containing protein [Planctomycetota bacterium]
MFDLYEPAEAAMIHTRATPPTPPGGRMVLTVRAALLLAGAALAGVFAAAFWVNPYNADGTPRARATHTQLGLAPCQFLSATGRPCASCGMTTSFSLLVRGDVAGSLRANWAGTVIAVLWAVALPWAVLSAARGRLLFVPLGRGEVALTACVGVVLAVMLGRWALILAGGE